MVASCTVLSLPPIWSGGAITALQSLTQKLYGNEMTGRSRCSPTPRIGLQPALNRLVARLEARSARSLGGRRCDSRAVVVCLTETGTALIERALVIHSQVVHQTLTSKFSETERTTLLRTFAQIGQ